jgi:hypothetical protein
MVGSHFRRSDACGYFLYNFLWWTIDAWFFAHQITFQETKLDSVRVQHTLQTRFAILKVFLNPSRTAAGLLLQIFIDLSVC